MGGNRSITLLGVMKDVWNSLQSFHEGNRKDDSKSDIEALAKAEFPDHDPSLLLEILNEYGNSGHEPEKERVQMAILKLSAGNEGKLLDFVAAAKQDYRDVLMWSNEPTRSPEQIEADRALVERLLRDFEKK